MPPSACWWATACALPPAPDTWRIESTRAEIASIFADRPLGLRDVMGYNRATGKHTFGRREMAVDGNWNLTMSTPMGERKASLSIKASGGTLTGTQGADGN